MLQITEKDASFGLYQGSRGSGSTQGLKAWLVGKYMHTHRTTPFPTDMAMSQSSHLRWKLRLVVRKRIIGAGKEVMWITVPGQPFTSMGPSRDNNVFNESF